MADPTRLGRSEAVKAHWTSWAILLGLAACLFFFTLLYEELQMMSHRKVVQSITTPLSESAHITTHRYEGESVEEWLAEHERALLRAAQR